MRARLVLGLVLATVLPLAGCGGDSEPKADATPTASSTAPADPAAATAEVTASWQGFFDGSKASADRAALLEDGASLAQAIALGEKDPNATKTRATVKSVAFTSPTQATVTYDLSVAGTTVLPGAQGKAVLSDGHWKVSKASYCQLLLLGSGGSPVPGCS
jgi:hypothetical protein